MSPFLAFYTEHMWPQKCIFHKRIEVLYLKVRIRNHFKINFLHSRRIFLRYATLLFGYSINTYNTFLGSTVSMVSLTDVAPYTYNSN